MNWVASRKARLLHAIYDGEMTEMDAYINYGITGPELSEWRKLYEKHGINGLKTTKMQRYRNKNEPI